MALDHMSRPLVSVCIPAYNAEKYIGQTITSVLEQSYAYLEIIVVDDGSIDHTFPVAKAYENGRVLVLRQENKGAGAARNTALAAAKGDYIQFLDADDLLSPDKIARQVELLSDRPGIIADCSTGHFMDGSDPLIYQPSPYEESFLEDDHPLGFLSRLYGIAGDRGSMV